MKLNDRYTRTAYGREGGGREGEGHRNVNKYQTFGGSLCSADRLALWNSCLRRRRVPASDKLPGCLSHPGNASQLLGKIPGVPELVINKRSRPAQTSRPVELPDGAVSGRAGRTAVAGACRRRLATESRLFPDVYSATGRGGGVIASPAGVCESPLLDTDFLPFPYRSDVTTIYSSNKTIIYNREVHVTMPPTLPCHRRYHATD